MIVEDIKALEQKLLGGENAAALRALADTEEARRLGRVIDSREAEQALRSGDSAQMRTLLQKLLATGEGRTLAEKLAGLGGKK